MMSYVTFARKKGRAWNYRGHKGLKKKEKRNKERKEEKMYQLLFFKSMLQAPLAHSPSLIPFCIHVGGSLLI
jgi:hypothetical protein